MGVETGPCPRIALLYDDLGACDKPIEAIGALVGVPVQDDTALRRVQKPEEGPARSRPPAVAPRRLHDHDVGAGVRQQLGAVGPRQAVTAIDHPNSGEGGKWAATGVGLACHTRQTRQ